MSRDNFNLEDLFAAELREGESSGGQIESIDPINSAISRKSIREERQDSLASLSGSQKKVILLRFGLGGEKPLTLREIADEMGVSESTVNRRVQEALKILREQYRQSLET